MTRLSKAQAKTVRAAEKSYASGQINKTMFNAMTDGKVTKTDLKNAKKALASAQKRFDSVADNRMGSAAETVAKTVIYDQSAHSVSVHAFSAYSRIFCDEACDGNHSDQSFARHAYASAHFLSYRTACSKFRSALRCSSCVRNPWPLKM